MSYRISLGFCLFKACLHMQLHRIGAAPHCAEFPIKMLWCEDSDECYNICNLDEVTKLSFISEMFWVRALRHRVPRYG